MRLTFDSDHLLEILERSGAAKERIAAPEHIYVSEFWRDNMNPALRRQCLEILKLDDENLPPVDRSHVGPRKVPAGLWLVGGHGVFLAPNVVAPDLEQSDRLVA